MAPEDQPVEHGEAARTCSRCVSSNVDMAPSLLKTRLLTCHREVEPNGTRRDQSSLVRHDHRRERTGPALPARQPMVNRTTSASPQTSALPPYHQPEPAEGPWLRPKAALGVAVLSAPICTCL